MSKENNEQDNQFPKKYEKVLKEMPEFKDSVDSMSTEELKAAIVLNETHLYETEKSLANNHHVIAAKDVLHELTAPYKDAMKMLKVKLAYIVFSLDSKGASQGESAVEEK
jgi:hypothetical protein